MTKQAAVELIARRKAEILDVQGRPGSLSRGKWASFVCVNGDPFNLTSHPVAVCGEGRLLCSCSRCHLEQQLPNPAMLNIVFKKAYARNEEVT